MKGAQLHIAGGIREFGRAIPGRVAVVDGDRAVTFGALDERSSRLASATLARGIRPGERIAILSNNRHEYFEIAAAMAKAGVPTVPLNTRNNVSDNSYVLAHSAARGIFVADELAPNVDGLLDDLPLVLSFDGTVGERYETFLEGGRAVDPEVPTDEMDPFCVTYTSGTTGRPKGVVLTHRGRALTMFGVGLDFGLGPEPQHDRGGADVPRRRLRVRLRGAVFWAAPCTMLRAWDPEALLALMESQPRAHGVPRADARAAHPPGLRGARRSATTCRRCDTLYFNAAALPVAAEGVGDRGVPRRRDPRAVRLDRVLGSSPTCGPSSRLRTRGRVGHPWFMTEVRVKDDNGSRGRPGRAGRAVRALAVCC